MEGNRRNFLNEHSDPQFKRKGVPSAERRRNFSLERLSGNSDLSDTVYRILCYSKKIGSVIGKGGNIVKSLREETQATITVTDSILGSDERIIIICSPSDKPANIQKLKNGNTSGKGDDVMEPHCAAQDALLKVHDRIVKEDLGGVESNNRDDLVVTARLLVSNSTVGCLLGKKGDVIQRLRSETGADIRVSPADHLPVCANSNEELVQISGTPDIAKKALYEVSARLHQNPRKDKPSLSFSSPYAHQGFHPSGLEERNILRSGDCSWSERNADVYNLSVMPRKGGHVTRPSKFEPEDFDGIGTPHDHETLSEFSMKILCSGEKIGGVIGKGGLNVKLLERETGASVHVENVSKESDERVIRVFSLEALSDQRSQTIDAILQLQNKTCELSEKGSVTTRLLVPSSKVGCILGQGGSIINEMRRRTQADIRVLSKEDKPKCAFDDEELVQVCGSFGVARDALTEISLRLRTRCLRDATVLVEPAPVRPIPRFDSARNLRGGLPRPIPIGAGSSGRYEHMTGGFRDHESPSYPVPPRASSYSIIDEDNTIFGGRHDVEFAGRRAKFHDPYFTGPDVGSLEQFNASRHIPDFGSLEQFNASRHMHQMHTSSAGPYNYRQSGAYQSYNSPHGVYSNASSHMPYQTSNPPSVAYQNIHTHQGLYQNTSAEGSYYYYNDRMSKAEMIRARKNKKVGDNSSDVADEAPKIGLPENKKRLASPELNMERRKKGANSGAFFEAALSEDFPLQPGDKGKSLVVELGDSPATSPTPLRSKMPYNYEDSLVQPGSEQAACYLFHNLLPEVDLSIVRQATDQEVDERMAHSLLQGLFWAAERSSRASKTRALYASSEKDMDDVWARHAVLTKQLQDYVDQTIAEKASLLAESKSFRERAEAAEQQASRIEQEKDRLALVSLSLQKQVASLELEAERQWPGKKEEFIKSYEFKVLCSDKALEFFEQGFQGCLDQFRANGYSPDDHPALFLDVDKALEALPDDGEIPETEPTVGEEAELKDN